MHVAYLVGQYPRATDTFIQREIRFLRQRGVQVHAISIRRPDPREWVSDDIRREAAQTHYVLPSGFTTLLASLCKAMLFHPVKFLETVRDAWRLRPPGFRGFVYQGFYLAEAVLVANTIRASRVSHIHNHAPDGCGTVTVLVSRLTDVPYSLTLHGPDIFVEPERWRLGEKIERAAFVACISSFARSQAMIYASSDATEHLHIVHCGIEPDRYTLRTHAGTGTRLLFVGRLARVKGWRVLLDAVERARRVLPEIHLTIVGDGPDRANIETELVERELDTCVSLVGYRTESQVIDHLSEADVFVLPSFAEGVPVVLMEAMAAGVPTVATRIAGTPELIQDGSEGILVTPGDANALADATVELLCDATLRNRIASAGRRKVEQEFNLGREVDWLHHLMTHRPSGRVRPRVPHTDRSTDASTHESSPVVINATARVHF